MKRQKQTLAKMFSHYRPNPGEAFYQKMEQAPWNKKEPRMLTQPKTHTLLRWQVAIGLLLLLILFGFGIPSVRASLSAWLGLSVAPANQLPAQAVTLIAATPPTPTAALPAVAPQPAAISTSPVPTETALPIQPDVPADQPADIRLLASQIGWKILTPAQLPEGYQFQSAYYDTNHKMVILTYLVTRPLPGAQDPSLTASKTITLLEAQKNDFVPMQIAPDTTVEDSQVNGQPAAYTVGAWDSEFVKDDNNPNGGTMVSTWRNDLPVQNLYWQVGQVYLLLTTNDDAVNKQALIDLASKTR